MSIRDLFEEELQKMGIDPSNINEYEVEDKKVILYPKAGISKIEINNEYLARLAKAKTNEEISYNIFSKDSLLKRLYALKNVFNGEQEWNNFIKEHKDLSKDEILNKIIEIENRKKDEISNLKKYLIPKISNRLKDKLPYLPPYSEIEEILNKKSTQELAEIYSDLSKNDERITISYARTLLNV
jgi:CRISPR/Cas system-associated exonuclease Cas4 (RecB family)